MMTPAQEKLIREFNTNCKRLFAMHEQKVAKEIWVSGQTLRPLINVKLLTLRQRNLMEWRVSSGGRPEYLLSSLPQELKKQNTI